MSPERNQERETVSHPFAPVYDCHSNILILGTITSPKSRETGFYYGHPQNRMWRVLANVLGEEPPTTQTEKRAFLLRNKIAMWDVLKRCEISRADDSSIRSPVPNDLSPIFQKAPIRAVFTTGRRATRLYEQYDLGKSAELPSVYLPSTSPANCRLSPEALAEEYRVILPYLER